MPVHRKGDLQKNLKVVEQAIPPALTAAGYVFVVRAQRIFAIFKPRGTATGATVRSMTVSPPEYVAGAYRVHIGPTTSYAWWLHWGRPPGKPPPIQRMIDWVREKHISGIYTRGRRRGGRSSQEREDRSAAYAIAAKIARDGTAPFPFLTTAFNQGRAEARRVFARVLASGVARGLTKR